MADRKLAGGKVVDEVVDSIPDGTQVVDGAGVYSTMADEIQPPLLAASVAGYYRL